MKRPHPAHQHSSSVCTPQNPAARHDSTLKSLVHRTWDNTSRRMRGVSPGNKDGQQSCLSFNCWKFSSWRVSSLTGESFHSHAGNHQVNSERRRGHFGGSVAAECLWTLPFDFPDPHWHVKKTTFPAGSRTGELNFSSLAKSLAARSTRPPETCARASVPYA